MSGTPIATELRTSLELRSVPNPDLGDISRLRGVADRDRVPLANPRSVGGVSYASWRREGLRGRHVHPTAEAGRPYRILRPRLRQVEPLPDQSRLDLFSATDQAFVQPV